MSEKVAVEILVQKAITLMSGESLYQYEENLRNAARDVVKRKYNLANDDGSYMAEVYDGASIWSVYKKNESPPHQYIMIEHTRDENGNFKFGGSMKVKRTTKYEPVGAVAKVTKGRWIEAEASSKESTKSDEGSTEKECGKERAVKKDFWNGVF